MLLYIIKYTCICINWDRILLSSCYILQVLLWLSQFSFDVDLTQAAIDGVHSMCPNTLMIRMQNWAGIRASMDASVHLNLILDTKDP